MELKNSYLIGATIVGVISAIIFSIFSYDPDDFASPSLPRNPVISETLNVVTLSELTELITEKRLEIIDATASVIELTAEYEEMTAELEARISHFHENGSLEANDFRVPKTDSIDRLFIEDN